MKYLLLFFLGVSTCFADAQGIMEKMYDVNYLWDAKALLDRNSTGYMSMLYTLCQVGISLLVLFFILRGITIYKDNQDLNVTGFSLIIETIFIGVLLVPAVYTWFTDITAYLIPKYIAQAVGEDGRKQVLQEIIGAMSTLSQDSQKDSSFMGAVMAKVSIPHIISSLCAFLSVIVVFVISMVQQVLYAVWFLLGPILLPCMLFGPFRNVAIKWFASLMGVGFMSIVGAIMTRLIFAQNLLTFTAGQGADRDYVSAAISAVIIILSMALIPAISMAIWSGVNSSMIAAAASYGIAAGATAKAGAAGTGASALIGARGGQMLANTVGGVQRFATNQDRGGVMDRAKDAFRNGPIAGSAADKASNSFGTIGNASRDLLESQLPGQIKQSREAVQKMGTPLSSAAMPTPSVQRSDVSRYASEKWGEQSKGLNIPKDFEMEAKPGMSYRDNIRDNAGSLMRAQGLLDDGKTGSSKSQGFNKSAKSSDNSSGSTTGGSTSGSKQSKSSNFNPDNISLPPKSQQQADIRSYASKRWGEENAAKLDIGKDFGVNPKKGQTYDQAVQGSARYLAQQAGIIDKKGENKIAKRRNKDES